MKTSREKKQGLLPIVEKIAAFIAREGSAPTYQEIAEMNGKTTRIQGFYIAKKLEKQGFIELTPNKKRSLVLKQS